MPILAANIVWNCAALASDTTPAQNGGRYTNTAIVSGVKNNLLPDVSSAQRLAGAEHWRKAFITVKTADNLALVDPRISIESGTPGDSYVLLHQGTMTDTQADTAGRPYGFGTLALAADTGDTEIIVTTEADYSALTSKPFQVGDVVRIDARTDVLTAGTFEYATVTAVAYDADTLTLTLANGLTADYAVGVKIASAIEPGDLQTAVTGKATTGGATYDDATYPILVPQIGAIQQTWTITVTDAATGALSVSGDTLGALSTGAVGANWSPTNPAGGTYFTVYAAGWGGTRANGDTLTFSTVPAACPVWYHRIVPAGAAAISSDPVSVCVEGESA
jgi:hypothetical protein